jgi:hypothetical protein
MRIPQREGMRGSLKWIQKAVNEAEPRSLDSLILPHLNGALKLQWCSPLTKDEFSEYRDNAFLNRIGAGNLSAALQEFWPSRGPQWDGLAVSDAGDVLLVEAKAHINELFSPASAASAASKKKILRALEQTALSAAAVPRSPWVDSFYQLGNRLAHLYFLRSRSVKAWLVLVNFVGDREMRGPNTQEEWEAAYKVVWYVMGLPEGNALSKYVLHCFPSVKA